MPDVVHLVSFRNGSQIMVRGLQLGERLGYCRNSRVQVTDPNSNPSNEPWIFIVPNDESATLACRNPPPPAWIQPGVSIRIEVERPIREAAAAESDAIPNPRATDVRVLAPHPVPLNLPQHIVYAVDVGSPGGGLAWARLVPHTGESVHGSMDFGHFLDLIVQDLRNFPVALGFEAPMFLPVTAAFDDLTRARTREPAAWSFGAGAYVTSVAIPLMSYILRHIKISFNDDAPVVTLDPSGWLTPDSLGSQLFLWEAFVNGNAHARGPNDAGLEVHLVDAATAVLAFNQWEATNPREQSHVTAQNAISTVGAAILWSGLANDINLLHRQALVLRPTQILGAGIVAYEPPAIGGG